MELETTSEVKEEMKPIIAERCIDESSMRRGCENRSVIKWEREEVTASADKCQVQLSPTAFVLTALPVGFGQIACR